jgi:hypothetical protein
MKNPRNQDNMKYAQVTDSQHSEKDKKLEEAKKAGLKMLNLQELPHLRKEIGRFLKDTEGRKGSS